MATTAVQAPPKDAAIIQSIQDVGLIFVREYYTFLNKRPDRLFAFYKKDSLFVRGDEGIPTETASGQEEIGKKLEECNFDDCKVLVTQVDSQLSSNNGILVHVLGEMCNQNNASQKFSQTFFLATQPNGYYVLNDIFRFLKDEVNIDYYTCEEEDSDEAVSHPQSIPVEVSAQTEVVEGPKEVVLERLEEKDEPVIPIVAEPTMTSPIPSKIVKQSSEDKSSFESEQGGNSQEESGKIEQEIEQPPSNQGFTKTWANLTAAAASAVGVSGTSTGSTSPEVSSPVTPEVTSPVIQEAEKPVQLDLQEIPQPQLPVPQKPFKGIKGEETIKPNGHKTQAKQYAKQDQVQTATIPSNNAYHNKNQGPRSKEFVTQIFVKQIHDAASEEQLKETFSAFGPVKYVNITKNRSCAFVEFMSHEAVPKALAQHKVVLPSGHTVFAEERRYNNNPSGNRYNGQNRNQSYNNNGTFERKPNNFRRQTTRPNSGFVKNKTVPTPAQKA